MFHHSPQHCYIRSQHAFGLSNKHGIHLVCLSPLVFQQQQWPALQKSNAGGAGGRGEERREDRGNGCPQTHEFEKSLIDI